MSFSIASWIHSVARIDERLLQLLRHARLGEWAYGQVPSTAEAKAVGPAICRSLGLDETLGMPDKVCLLQ
jgi:hypothetical protein